MYFFCPERVVTATYNQITQQRAHNSVRDRRCYHSLHLLLSPSEVFRATQRIDPNIACPVQLAGPRYPISASLHNDDR